MNLRTLIAVGLAAVALGLLLGLVPSSVTTASGDTTCGSPWVRDNSLVDAATDGSRLGADLVGGQVGRRFESTDYRAQCDDAIGARGGWAAAITGFGVLALLGAALVNANRNGSVAQQNKADGEDAQSKPADRQGA